MQKTRPVNRDATFFLLIGVSCYFLLSLITFSPFDPSATAVSSETTTVFNLGGVVGAYLSGAVLYYLGLVGFCLPLSGVVIFIYRARIVVMFALVFQTLICLLYVLEVYAPVTKIFAIDMPSSGSVGHGVTATINSTLGIVGGHVLIVTVFGYLLLAATRAHILGMVFPKKQRRARLSAFSSADKTLEPFNNKNFFPKSFRATHSQTVHLGDILHTEVYRQNTSPLQFVLGEGVDGKPMCHDLQTVPHLLVAGNSGAGKTTILNAMLCSILCRATPDTVQFLLLDSKMGEFSIYDGIPHLMRPVITDVAQTQQALVSLQDETRRRAEVLRDTNTEDSVEFKKKWENFSYDDKIKLKKKYNYTNKEEFMPNIVCVIAELADITSSATQQTEATILCLTKEAHRCGIHLVVATQRPSVDIITDTIKGNLHCRIAFRVNSEHDSRTILDVLGAEKLCADSEMLFQYPGIVKPLHVQGVTATDDEIRNFIMHLRM